MSDNKDKPQRDKQGRFLKGNSIYKIAKGAGAKRKIKDANTLRKLANKYFQYIMDNPLKEELVVNKQWTEYIDKPIEGETNDDGSPKTESVKVTHPYSRTYVNKARPFTLQSLCVYIGIHIDTFYEYEKKAEYSEVIKMIRVIIDSQQFEGAASGFFNSNLIARRMGLYDHKKITTENESTDPDDIDNEIEELLKLREQTDQTESDENG